jgi:hypothetical protein
MYCTVLCCAVRCGAVPYCAAVQAWRQGQQQPWAHQAISSTVLGVGCCSTRSTHAQYRVHGRRRGLASGEPWGLGALEPWRSSWVSSVLRDDRLSSPMRYANVFMIQALPPFARLQGSRQGGHGRQWPPLLLVSCSNEPRPTQPTILFCLSSGQSYGFSLPH